MTTTKKLTGLARRRQAHMADYLAEGLKEVNELAERLAKKTSKTS